MKKITLALVSAVTGVLVASACTLETVDSKPVKDSGTSSDGWTPITPCCIEDGTQSGCSYYKLCDGGSTYDGGFTFDSGN